MTSKTKKLVVLGMSMALVLGIAAAQLQRNARSVVSTGSLKGFPDVAYDAQAGLYLLVWQERSGSGDDRDIRARLLNPDGTAAGEIIALASSAEDERFPKVAASGSSSWTAVWSTGQAIEACAIDMTGRATAFRTLTPASSRPVDHPDIGALPEGMFLAVWEEFGETGLTALKARSLRSDGSDGEEFLLAASPDQDLLRPSVNQDGSRSFVAWEKPVDARRVDIEGRLVSPAAASAEDAGDIVLIASDNARNTLPRVAAVPGSDAFVVVWQRSEGRRASDISYATVTARGVETSGKLTDSPEVRETKPFVSGAGLAGRLLVTYQTAPAAGPLQREIAARTFGWGEAQASDEVVIDAARAGGGNPASVLAAGAGGRGLIVWDVKEGEGTDLYAKEWLAPELADGGLPLDLDGPIVPLADITVSGLVTFNGVPQAGVLMSGFPGEIRTDATGAYAAAVPAPWSGTVTPVQPGFAFTPASRTYVDLGVDSLAENYTAAYVGGAEDAYEDNDDFATAADLPLGTTQDLILRDSDWFKFYVPAADAGKDLKIRVWGTGFPDTTTRRDLDFAVLDAAGRAVGFGLGGGSDETAFVPDAAEGYYFVCQDYIGLAGTVYAITAELSDAFGLGYVEGHVTDDLGAPIEGATVELYSLLFDWDVSRPLTFTDDTGFYRIAWLPGDYTVRFNITDFGNDGLDWTPDANYLGEMYNWGEVVSLSPGATVTDIDANLTPGGVVSGSISDGSGAPLTNAVATVYGADTGSSGNGYTDASGHYTIDRIRTGNFAVRSRNPNGTPLINEWYDDHAGFAAADPVGIEAGATTPGIDARLEERLWGTIQGHVTDGLGNPVGNMVVAVVDPMGLSLWSFRTDSSGFYSITRVPTGSWKVFFNATSVAIPHLVPMYYPGTRLLGEAALVTVQAGEITDGVDLSLPFAGSISGQVSANQGSVNMIAFDTAAGGFSRSVSPTLPLTGPRPYTITNLLPGTYKVMARPNQQGDRIPHWYPDAASYAAAGTVTVTAGGVTSGVDVALASGGGTITGRIVDSGGLPIAGVAVIVQDASGQQNYASFPSNVDGYYTVRQIPPGTAKVYFNADANWLGYVSEYSNDKSSFGTADAVAVTEGETTTLDDAVLAARPALAVTTTVPADGQVAVPYSQQLAAAGGRPFYRWTLESGALPDGLTMSARGLIAGIPTMTGTSSFTVRVTDSTLPQGSVLQPLSITIGEYAGSGFTISGTVTAGGLPLAGVLLDGLPGDPVTSASGTYVAVVDTGFWDTVTPVLAGYAFSPAQRTYTVVTGNLSGQDYAASTGYRLSGSVTVAGAPLSGVRLTGLPTEIRTDDQGTYSIMIPSGWSGTVTPVLTGFTFSPVSRTYEGFSADALTEDYAATFLGGQDDLYEDNDSFETAAEIATGAVVPDLVLLDQDWFKFYVPAEEAGKFLGIRIFAISFPNGTARSDPSQNKDLDYGVMDATGQLLTHSISGSVDEVTFIPDIQPGWYYIANTYMPNPGMVYAVYVITTDDLPVATISGRITDASSGEGVDGVSVELWRLPFDWNESRPMAITGPDGTYKIATFPGDVQVQVNLRDFNLEPSNGLPVGWLPVRNYLAESYDHNKTLTLAAGSAVTGIDVALRPGGTISGQITDGAGSPLAGARAYAYVAPGNQFSYAIADGAGQYTIRRLKTANYRVAFRPPDGSTLGREWYEDRISLGTALTVPVTEGASTDGIDAALTEGASVSGRVTNTLGDPIPNVTVTAHDMSGIAMQSALTQADGTYALGRLPADGSVKVLFNAATCVSGNYLSEWYADKDSSGAADAVTTFAGQTTDDIDAVLAPAGSISGRLEFPSDYGMLGGFVQAYNAATGTAVAGVNPDYEGNYSLRNLAPGNYRVRFSYTFSWITNYPPKWYPSAGNALGGTILTVAAGDAVTGIDGYLTNDGGSLTGRVTDGAAGVPAITVAALDGDLGNVATTSAVTDADGYYTVRNVPGASVKVFFYPGAKDYPGEFFLEKGDFSSADRLDVTPGLEIPLGVEVLGPKPALTVTTASLPAGELGAAYDQTLGAANGNPFYHWSIAAGALPPGLAMISTGVILGAPTQTGTYDFTVRVTDSTYPQKSQTRDLSITVGEYTGVGYTISGTVTLDGLPFGGVNLYGLPGDPRTNAAGGYVAVVPSGWTGTVRPGRPGYAFTPATMTYSNVSADHAAQDYTATPGFLISGTVTLGGNGLTGVLMAGLPGEPLTDWAGAFAAVVPAGWDGTVTPTLPGTTFVPANIPFTDVSSDMAGQNFVATYAGGVDDAFEDNDTLETAAVLPLGTTTGLIAHDEEWFKFYVPAEDAGKDIRVHIWGTGFPDTVERRDLDFHVLNSTPLALSTNLSGGADETAYLCDAAEGWYTIGPMFFSIDGMVYAIAIDANEDFGLGYIEGTVRDDGGTPIAGVAVELYGEPFNWDISRPLIFTDASGHYRIGYLPGPYTVRFNLATSGNNPPYIPDANYLGETYNGGEVLTLAAGVTLTDIDGRLEQGGAIAGRVTDSAGNPQLNIWVYAHAGDTTLANYTLTTADGNYVVKRLRTGNYAVRVRPVTAAAVEWYDNAGNFSEAMPVPVAAGETTGGIDFVYGTPGAIAGCVRNGAGDPIPGVTVNVYDPAGIAIRAGTTDEAGNYYVGRVPTGAFKVQFNAATAFSGDYISEYYPDAFYLNDAEYIDVTAGQTTGGIDGVLGAAGTITGTVTGGGNALAAVAVHAFSADGSLSYTATTDTLGVYTIRNLPPGDYRVRFRPGSGDWTVAWFDGQGSFSAADAVAVAAGAVVPDIDGDLEAGGGLISGRVTNAFGAPIAGLTVIAQDTAIFASISSALTDEDGNYTINRLPEGQAKVWFNADLGRLNYFSEYHNDKGDHGSADAVPVTAGETTAGIDAVLDEQPALAVTTEALAMGELATGYDGSLQSQGGRPFYHWSLESGALPDGLSVDGRGRITGIPTRMGTFEFTVRVTDSTVPQQAASRTLSITIGEYMGLGHAISGRVTAGGQPLGGVTLGGLPGTPVTNSAGSYVGIVTDGWSGTVTPSLGEYSFTPATRTYDMVSASIHDQDYAAFIERAISGTVRLDAAGLAGVVLSGLPGSPATASDGTYSGVVPDGWSGTVTPTLQGYTFTPASRTYTALAADVTEQDYAATAVAPSTVKVDFNGDGQEDILWRYYGTGGIEGWNVVWLMEQTGVVLLPMTTALNSSNPRAMTDIDGGRQQVITYRSPLETGKALRWGGAKTMMGPITVGRRMSSKPKKITKDPFSATRRKLPKEKRRAVALDLAERSDKEIIKNICMGGTTEIAALGSSETVFIPTVQDTLWELAGTGDFDYDGDTDVLWRYYGIGDSQGLNVIWHMNGTTIEEYSFLPTVQDTEWRIEGTGDFNGDGSIEILWRNYGNGAFQGWDIIWYMNGSQILTYGFPAAVTDLSWKVAAIGDFNGDAKADLLWRYYGTGDLQGLNVIWLMDGAQIMGYGYPARVADPNWRVDGAGDFDGDLKADLLWRYYGTDSLQGWTVIWYMNEAEIKNQETLTTVYDISWRIVNK